MEHLAAHFAVVDAALDAGGLNQGQLDRVGELQRGVALARQHPPLREETARLSHLAQRISASGARLGAWIGQRRQEAITTAVEALLPAGWDLQADTVLLLGSQSEVLGRGLLRYGQKRLLLYKPDWHTDDAISVASIRELMVAMEQLRDPPMGRIVVRRTGETVSEEEGAEVGAAARDAAMMAAVDGNTTRNMGGRWGVNALWNFPHLIHMVPARTIAPGSVPCVIVAPGPSLAKNVGLLNELQGEL